MICTIANKPVAQGELLICRVGGFRPEECEPMKLENGRYIIGHSETGHHHVVYEQEGVAAYADKKDPLTLYLVVNNPKKECLLKHERNHDTHKSFQFDDGVYRIRRQIESGPEGYRVALD